MASKRTTIADLARETGLSRSTISKVFSGSDQVLPETRRLVLQSAEALRYPVRTRKHSRTSQKTGRYGLILPNLDNPHYSELVHTLDSEARRNSKIMLLGLHYGDPKVAESLLRHWFSGLTDGVIIDAPEMDSVPHAVDLLRSRSLPVVFLHGGLDKDCFMVHHHRGPSYRRALRQLVDLGHRRIAYVGVDARWARSTESFVEYRAVIETLGLKLNEDYLFFGRNESESGFEGLGRLIRQNPRPTAIVCFNDILACGVFHALRVQRFRVPDDMSVVGGDNICEAARLGLTTVHADRTRMAREVFRLLQAQESDPNRPAEEVNIPTELIVRESVSIPPKE